LPHPTAGDATQGQRGYPEPDNPIFGKRAAAAVAAAAVAAALNVITNYTV